MPIQINDIDAQPAANERIIPAEASRSVATYTLLSDGNAVSRTFHVASILVQKEINRVPFATIILTDGDPAAETFPVSNAPDFEPGRELEIKLGFRSEEETVFKGIVIRHGIKVKAGSAVLVVECRDAAVKMTIAPKSKYYREATDSEVLEEIINTYGFRKDIAATALTHKELVQYQTTDWDFMLCRADANGLLCLVNDGEIKIAKPDLSAAAILNIQFGATIYELDAEIDARLQFKNITATAWDASEGELTGEVTGGDPGVPEAGNLSAEQLSSILEVEDFSLRHDGALSESELQQWADSKLLKSRLAKIRGRVTTDGTAAVKAGQFIELQGAGERFQGKLFVTGVRQHLSEGMWRTTFQFGLNPEWFAQQFDVTQPLAGALLPPVQGLHIGVVTDLKDPDGQNRIMVRVPTIMAADDGIWSRISTLDAGKNRGTFILPEIGDEVIVGFINNDPRYAVVLGMMNSAARPAPLNAENDNHEKGYVSRSELKLLFNDDKKSIQIETPAGNKVLISEDEQKVALEDQHGNKLTMDADGILLESIKDLILKAQKDISVAGVNLTLDGQAQTKVSGGAGAEFSSSGSTAVKGSLVQIN